VAQALLGQTLRVPIRGTLHHPQIDAKALGVANAGVVLDALREWLKNRPPPGERLFDRLRDRETPLLDRLRDGRQRRKAEGEGRKAEGGAASQNEQ